MTHQEGDRLHRAARPTVIIFTTAALFFLCAIQALADPSNHWYQRGPLGLTERSVGCMVQPWKDWKCAGLHYAIFGADFFDYKSSQYGLRNCASCVETNPMFGSGRPGTARMFGLGAGLSLLTEHPVAEYAYEKGPRKGLVAAGVFIGIHTTMGIRQYGISPDRTGRVVLPCAACTPVP
jgi:hypothetical protein